MVQGTQPQPTTDGKTSEGYTMLKKLENIFIWACGVAFLVAAVCTLFAFIVGLVIYIGRYLNG